MDDVVVQSFLALRRRFFQKDGSPLPFPLRDKRNTQDDPLDEYLHQIFVEELSDVECIRAPGPLTTPDMVILRPSVCQKSTRAELRSDLDRIVAIEVKKLERTHGGTIARQTGLDYNTTPPCGIVRIYDSSDQPLDIRGFYLFVCQEPVAGKPGYYTLSALALCDGNLLNEDFDYYLSIVGERTKRIGLGTYGNGADRNRPMVIFANPLGSLELDHQMTLIHAASTLAEDYPNLQLTHILQRSVVPSGQREFYCYRLSSDVSSVWQTKVLRDPFPIPQRRDEITQARGKFKLHFKPVD